MVCPPPLVNSLVVQVSDTPEFTSIFTQVLPAATSNFPVNGTANQIRYVRAKWRRTEDPLEESDWSAVLTLHFPPIKASDIDSVPGGDLERPDVPIIQAIYGWKEFIEVVVAASAGLEKVEAFYAGTFGSGSSTGKCGLGVKNLSSDPTIAIWSVDYMMGANPANCAGFISFTFDPIDTAPLTRPYLALDYNFTTMDPAMPGTPPKVEYDWDGEMIGESIKKYVRYKMCPRNENDSTLVCPQDSELPCAGPSYFCQDAYFGARLRLYEFSQQARGIQPYLLVQFYARALAVYVDALGRTAFPPQLPALPSTGYYGSFQGNLPERGPAVIRVKFSTGREVQLNAEPLGPDASGLRWTAPAQGSFVLDDYFLFISEAPFSETLDDPEGLWQNALGIRGDATNVVDGDTVIDPLQPSLPDGVYVARIGRESNLLASNLGGVRLETGKTYYFRVGARRPTSFTQKSPDFLYSPTLSALHTGRLGSSTADANINDPARDTIIALVDDVAEPVQTLIPGTGIAFDLDGNQLTISADTVEEQGVYEESGWLFVVPGLPLVATDACFQIETPCDGTFTDWVFKAKTAPQGAAGIVDVHMDGSSIFNNGANRPTLPALATSATGTAFFTNTFLKGQVLRFDVDQVGSTLAGERFQLQVNYRGKLKQ